MKNKVLIGLIAAIIVFGTFSCKKEPTDNTLIDDKDKIDIKGSLSNGDMRHPNIEAGYLGKTVYVYFHDYMGYCTVTVSNAQDSILFQEESPT